MLWQAVIFDLDDTLYPERQYALGGMRAVAAWVRRELGLPENRSYRELRQLFDQRRSITTFGPYSPGQAVAMKRIGIEGIYLGGWATSAKGSITEDPGPDLASYPLSQVPEEAAPIVRALLTADRNQRRRSFPAPGIAGAHVRRRQQGAAGFDPFRQVLHFLLAQAGRLPGRGRSISSRRPRSSASSGR